MIPGFFRIVQVDVQVDAHGLAEPVDAYYTRRRPGGDHQSSRSMGGRIHPKEHITEVEYATIGR